MRKTDGLKRQWKILVISDVVESYVYSNSIKERFEGIDFVISCGDLPFNYYDFIVSSLNVPLFYVLGNHPPKIPSRGSKLWLDEYPPGCINLDSRVVVYKGLRLSGAKGALRYNRNPWSPQFTQGEMQRKLWRMWPRLYWERLRCGRALDIFVSHAPPFSIHDLPDQCHTGFKAFLSFMKRFKPRFLIHGHVHLYDRNAEWKTDYEHTSVVNAYGYKVIELHL